MSMQLTSARLVLAPFTAGDISPLYVGWLNDPEVVRYSNQRFRRHDLESSEAYLRSFAGGPNQFWSIRLAADRSMIGTMTAYIAPQHGTADMGLLVGQRSVWGQGYGYEAWQRLMDHLLGEQALRKITAGAASGNGAWDASIANLFSPGDKVLVPQTGFFADRWSNTARASIRRRASGTFREIAKRFAVRRCNMPCN